MKITTKIAFIAISAIILTSLVSARSKNENHVNPVSAPVSGCDIGKYNVKLTFVAKNKKYPAIDAVFDVRDLNPESQKSKAQKLGWLFTIEKFPSNVFETEFFVKEGDKYFLPYKHFKEWAIKEVVGSPKGLTASYQLASGDIYIFNCTFNYDPNWDALPSELHNKLKDWIIQNTNTQIIQVAALKKKLQDEINKYFINRSLADKFTDDAKEKEKNKKELEKENSKIQAQITALKTKLEQQRKVVKEKKNALSNIQSEYDRITGKISINTGMIKSDKNQIITLENSMNTHGKKSNDYKAKAAQALQAIESKNAQVKPECADKGYLLDEAVKYLKQQRDADGFDEIISAAILGTSHKLEPYLNKIKK